MNPPAIHCGQAPKTNAAGEASTQKRHFTALSKEFRRHGFDFHQIAREGSAAIYSQTWSGCPDPAICFEVIRVKRREGFEIDGRSVPPGEVYPASRLWGVDGFTFSDKYAAFEKLRQLA